LRLAFVALLIAAGDHVDHPRLHVLIGTLGERRPHAILGDLAKGVGLDIGHLAVTDLGELLW
jgi:hypothetical protein